MIRASLNASDLVRQRSKPERVLLYLKRRMDVLLLQLQAKIVGEKLQGQVLQHITGKLGRSVVLDPSSGATISGLEVHGSVIGATSPAGYGVGHEYGTDTEYEIVPMSKKALMWISAGGAKHFAARVMHPPLKERSFMRSSLMDMENRIITGLKEAAIQGASQ